MIIKLQQIESLIKEVGQKRKRKNKALLMKPGSRRRSSVTSTAQNFQKQMGILGRPDSKQVIVEANEDAASDDSN